MAVLNYLTDRGSFLREVSSFPVGVTNDGVLGFTVGGKNYVRTKKGSTFKSEELGVYANGVDATTKLQNAFNHSAVKTIEIDAESGGNIVLNGTLTVPSGKTLKIKNGTKLIGTGTLVNAKIEAGIYPVFASTLTLTNCDPLIGFFPPEWFGAIGDGTTDDTASMQACLNSAIRNTGGLIKLLPNKNYKITSVTIKSFKEGQIPNFTLDGCNATVTVDGANTGFVKNVTAQGGTGGADQEVNSRIHFKEVRFVGSNIVGSKAVRIAPTYGTMFTMCNFGNFDTAVDLRFCLNTMFIECYFQQSISYDVILADGDWTGASGNNSQSNQTKMINCRHFCKTGQLAAVRILKTSGVVLDDCIYEGGNPIRNIEFDSTGSTTVQHFNIIRPHVENAPTSESVYLKTTALVNIEQYWAQLAHVAVRADMSTDNPRIRFSNSKYMIGDNLKFAAHGNGGSVGTGVWYFENMDFSLLGDPTTFWARKFIDDATYKIPFYKYWSTNTNTYSNLYAYTATVNGTFTVSTGISVFNTNTYHKSLTYLEGNTYLSPTKFLYFGNDAGVGAQAIGGNADYVRWSSGARYVQRVQNDGKMTLGWDGVALADVDMSGSRSSLLPPKLAVDDSSPVEGMLYFNTVSKKLKYYNGTAWIEIDVSASLSQVLTNKTLGVGSKINLGTVALGDTYYGGADGTINRLAIGAEGTFLKSVGGVPAWVAIDGSETKLSNGTNITITGSGTIASPYVINAATYDGSETKLVAGTDVTISGAGTIANPYVINSTGGGGTGTGVTFGDIRTITTSGNFLVTDGTILVDTSAGNVTLTLNFFELNRPGTVIKVSDDVNTVTIVPSSGTLNGQANYTLVAPYEAITMVNNGVNFFITNKL